jgi:enoyl-CoA hydratase/carnithine racemase
MGSGIELAAFTDWVVAAADSQIALPEIGLGLVPGAGGTVSLTRRIGRLRTAWLAFSGSTIDAATARTWGLVDELGA